MCKRVSCPNDGKPTWWGCGNHIETALAGVAKEDRCDCPHVPVASNPSMFEVKPNDDKKTCAYAPNGTQAQAQSKGSCLVM